MRTAPAPSGPDRRSPPVPNPRRSPGEWFRRRKRIVVAALVFVAVVAGLRALAPDGGATHRVAAPIHDLPAGHVIEADDLDTVRLSGPASARDTSRPALVGKTLVLPWPKGVPLHRRALAGADVARNLPAGQVAVGLQPGRGSPIGFIRPGDLVDVIVSPEAGGGRAEPATVVDGVRVLSVSGTNGKPGKGGNWLGGEDDDEPVIVVSVPRASAADVSSAPRRGTVSLVVSG